MKVGDFCWRDKSGIAYLQLPFSVTLSNGLTRTDPNQWSLEPDVLLDTGWSKSILNQEDIDLLFPPQPPAPELSPLELGFQTPEGWRLGWKPDDVALLTGLYVLSKESNELGLNQPIIVTDTSGGKHELTFEQFKTIMLMYGNARAQASADGLL